MSGIDWAAIDWPSLIVLTVVVLIAARLGERLSFGSRALASILTAALFAAAFGIWSYSLHDTVSHAIAMMTPANQG
jgi:hypothetical protein